MRLRKKKQQDSGLPVIIDSDKEREFFLWVQSVLGRPYKIFSKLPYKSAGRQSLSADSDFFCSELSAKALKVLGTLAHEDEASFQFWPSSFAETNDDWLKTKLKPGQAA